MRIRTVAVAGAMLALLAAGCSSDEDDPAANPPTASSTSTAPETSTTTSTAATCVEMPTIDISGPLDAVRNRTGNDQATWDRVVAELDAVVGAAMIGVCTDAAVAWCESQRLFCPVLVSDGVQVLEPIDDEDAERFFLTEADGAVTGAAIDYGDLAEVPGTTD